MSGVDVALAAEADGVHLKSDSIPTALVRRHVPAAFLVGRSVHSVDEARSAEAEGADYVISAPCSRRARSRAAIAPPGWRRSLR